MTYQAKEPKFLWILLFILTITYAYALESTLWTYIAYSFAFIFFAAITMSYQLEIVEDKLIYVIEIFGFAVKKRTILAREIEKLNVIQIGQKSILLVYLKKGFRIKLQRFQPEDVTSKMIDFASGNNIKVVKTGDA
ncbi:hypothetical protein ACFFHM_03360 [Halalkalibacter kiskunsagensis]|uniref:Pore-forming protein n=1 Tax=Halalkalibacter kiskunsagensis TaxID=1548599 RepID=A0ABV6KBX8_9BACI